MKTNRLFQLLYILLEKQTSTAPELARQLEVSVRTIYRDIETLSSSGVPIYAMAGKGGGISIMPGYTFDKALLSDDEQDQILFAIQSLQVADQDVDELLQKLGGAFQKVSTNWIEVDFSRWGMKKTDSERFECLKTAILEKRVLRIIYCGTSGSIGERDVEPLKLIFKNKSWYLQAFCLKAEDLRLFKVNRIKDIELTDVVFTEGFDDLPSLESDELYAFEGTEIYLKFPSSLAFRVYDEFERNSIEVQPDGSLCVSVIFPLDDWAYSYLLSFGTNIEIVEPIDLREQLTDYAKRIYEHHKT